MNSGRIIERVETPYNSIDVWQRPRGYDFEVAGGTHATWDRDHVLTGYAWDAITAGVLLRPGAPPRSLLLLGLGGGTVVRQLRHFLPNLHVTAVEIDPRMVALARRYMALDELDVEVIIDDAYAYLKRCVRRFDVLVDDVYLGSDSDVRRPMTLTGTSMSMLADRITPGGTVVANLVLGRGHRKMHKNVKSAFLEWFPQVQSVKPPKGFNESLAGGQKLCDGARLHEFDSALTSPLDQQIWKNIRCRRVSRPASKANTTQGRGGRSPLRMLCSIAG